MKLTFFGAARAVTGSCHCVECGGKKVLVDCGLQQGRDERDGQALDFFPGDMEAGGGAPAPTFPPRRLPPPGEGLIFFGV